MATPFVYIAREAPKNSEKSQNIEVFFSGLYNNSFERVYRFLYYRVSHKETAEDLAEETFVRAWKNVEILREAKTPEAWLLKVARNILIDHYRAKKENVTLEEVEHMLIAPGSVVDEMQASQEQQKLLGVIGQLSLELQSMVRLKFFEGLSAEEIAVVMDKSPVAVRVALMRAMRKLKTLWGDR